MSIEIPNEVHQLVEYHYQPLQKNERKKKVAEWHASDSWKAPNAHILITTLSQLRKHTEGKSDTKAKQKRYWAHKKTVCVAQYLWIDCILNTKSKWKKEKLQKQRLEPLKLLSWRLFQLSWFKSPKSLRLVLWMKAKFQCQRQRHYAIAECKSNVGWIISLLVSN